MLCFELNNGETASWHVGKKAPKIENAGDWEQDNEFDERSIPPDRSRLRVVEVFADSDELTYVLAQFDNLPKLRETTDDNATTNLIVRNMRGTRWFGDMARFIYANLRT